LLLWVVVTTALQGIALRFCPPELVISDTCAADWYRVVDQLAISGGATAGALAMVALPTWIAPSDRYRVSLVSFSLGSFLALLVLLAFGTWAVAPFLSALAAGILAVVVFGRRGHAV
jgi:hypothetical protein